MKEYQRKCIISSSKLINDILGRWVILMLHFFLLTFRLAVTEYNVHETKISFKCNFHCLNKSNEKTRPLLILISKKCQHLQSIEFNFDGIVVFDIHIRSNSELLLHLFVLFVRLTSTALSLLYANGWTTSESW